MPKKPSVRNHQLLSIIVIDDNKFTRDLLRRILVSFGMSEVTSAESGEEALRILSAEHFDLIICDIVMDRMNGIQFLKSIRKKEIFPGSKHETPVIMLSAHADEKLVVASLKAGANGYLVKPVVPAKLTQLIAKLCHSTVPTLRSSQKEGLDLSQPP